MKHSRHSGKLSTFIIGAALGAIAVEAAMCATCPPAKRMMMKKGLAAARMVRDFGERIF